MKLVQLLKSVGKVKLRRKKGGYLVIDFRDEYIKLPGGAIIPKERILNIDTEKKVIVYLDENNIVREAKYG